MINAISKTVGKDCRNIAEFASIDSRWAAIVLTVARSTPDSDFA